MGAKSYQFTRVLDQDLFKWRKAKEEYFDERHDATMAKLLRRPFNAEVDFELHKNWSESRQQKPLTPEEEHDLREMLKVRGVLKAEDFPGKPVQDRRAPKGGGGRKRAMGMRAPAATKKSRQGSATEADAEMPDAFGHDDDHPDHADVDYGDFDGQGTEPQWPEEQMAAEFGGFDNFVNCCVTICMGEDLNIILT